MCQGTPVQVNLAIVAGQATTEVTSAFLAAAAGLCEPIRIDGATFCDLSQSALPAMVLGIGRGGTSGPRPVPYVPAGPLRSAVDLDLTNVKTVFVTVLSSSFPATGVLSAIFYVEEIRP